VQNSRQEIRLKRLFRFEKLSCPVQENKINIEFDKKQQAEVHP
jgi:hypothetical protein